MAAEEQFITLATRKDDLGQIKIAPQVIEVVAGIAAIQVDGVNRMQGNFSTSVKGLFGRKERTQGVKLLLDDQGQLNIDVYVYFDYGVSVPQVALQIQEQVRQQLLVMTDLHVLAVNVHVEGVVPERTPKVDTDLLFNSDGEDREN
ncbi:Asp23/Gls24 family envelope stress response protein [Fructilactobacillus ixorae]|uniref:Asp23/Gls24 family envelope stress response protein n=2 Tax=Fructilactobacillus TaxID=2767881 RepID=A0ABY5BNZ3_9LACO|nr:MULTISPECIES: Asp23/Gls24 family envelope stress response protein [Fructilactobacillus]USS85280.1 Asp23/Gls24 family envelope stress response protein [Fructilactobacillus myrtifloralis]USS93865.1 Asp23/Gls24 family envelope stress response protein [Fructilactobacillus ixorae]